MVDMDYADILGQKDIGNKVELLVSLLYHSLLHPGARAVDGGANGGLHTIPMARLVKPAGTIFAYEPQPDIIQRVTKWATSEGLEAVVKRRCVALGDKPGRVSFFVKSATQHIIQPGSCVRSRGMHRDCGNRRSSRRRHCRRDGILHQTGSGRGRVSCSPWCPGLDRAVAPDHHFRVCPAVQCGAL